MNRDDWLHEMAVRARHESPPQIDVADHVRDRIRNVQARHHDPMLWMAGTSAAAAAIVLACTLQMWSTLADPMSALLYSMNTVLQ